VVLPVIARRLLQADIAYQAARSALLLLSAQLIAAR
jgi:hypothetical protein